MGLHNNCYAKIWSAKPYGQIYYCQLSVSVKDKNTNAYKNTFSRTVSFCGEAAKKVPLLGLPEKYEPGSKAYKSIKITNCDIQTYYNKKKLDELLPLANGNTALEYFIKDKCNDCSVTVFDFEIDNGSGTATPQNRAPQQQQSQQEVPTQSSGLPQWGNRQPAMDEDLPFDM